MTDYAIKGDTLKSIADAIREKTSESKPIKTSEIANEVSKVYEAGKAKGVEGLNGYDEGREAEHKVIWGAIQNHGNRTEYGSAFAAGGWNKENFKPAFDMRPTLAASMFARLNNSPADAPQIDFVALAKEQGIVFDFSNCTNFNMCFGTGGISRLGVIDFKGATNLGYVFYGTYNSSQGLQSIEKLICYAHNVFQPTAFQACKFLTHLPVEGVIASSINLKDCPLDLESAKSVLLHLKNYDTSEGSEIWGTVSVLFNADVWALLDAEGSTMEAGDRTWRDYVWTLGWTT